MQRRHQRSFEEDENESSKKCVGRWNNNNNIITSQLYYFYVVLWCRACMLQFCSDRGVNYNIFLHLHVFFCFCSTTQKIYCRKVSCKLISRLYKLNIKSVLRPYFLFFSRAYFTIFTIFPSINGVFSAYFWYFTRITNAFLKPLSWNLYSHRSSIIANYWVYSTPHIIIFLFLFRTQYYADVAVV